MWVASRRSIAVLIGAAGALADERLRGAAGRVGAAHGDGPTSRSTRPPRSRRWPARASSSRSTGWIDDKWDEFRDAELHARRRPRQPLHARSTRPATTAGASRSTSSASTRSAASGRRTSRSPTCRSAADLRGAALRAQPLLLAARVARPRRDAAVPRLLRRGDCRGDAHAAARQPGSEGGGGRRVRRGGRVAHARADRLAVRVARACDARRSALLAVAARTTDRSRRPVQRARRVAALAARACGRRRARGHRRRVARAARRGCAVRALGVPRRVHRPRDGDQPARPRRRRRPARRRPAGRAVDLRAPRAATSRRRARRCDEALDREPLNWFTYFEVALLEGEQWQLPARAARRPSRAGAQPEAGARPAGRRPRSTRSAGSTRR